MGKKEIPLSGLQVLDIIDPNGAMGCTGDWQVGEGLLFGLLGAQFDGVCWEGKTVSLPPDRRVRVQRLDALKNRPPDEEYMETNSDNLKVGDCYLHPTEGRCMKVNADSIGRDSVRLEGPSRGHLFFTRVSIPETVKKFINQP